VYEGEAGPGRAKQIVLLAGDHEYRSEETLPALARILAKHYGFRCTVLFTTDPQTGDISPGSSHISGLAALKTADLMVVFLRFQNFPQDEMQHLVDYLDSGRPIVGLRTSTHAFKIEGDGPFAKYSYRYAGKDFEGGFGRQVLGETWAGHYGKNHATSARFLIENEAASHPILRGVQNVWVQSGAYEAHPLEGSRILAKSQVLNGMDPKSPPAEGKELMPAAWVREYKSSSGKSGRVFATTHGASEDILNDGCRRLLVNACLWAAGLEDSIRADGKIGFVGPYHPVTFRFGGYRRGIKPSDLAAWDSPIMRESAPVEDAVEKTTDKK
jgi:type 1 glutamine amidotransferase